MLFKTILTSVLALVPVTQAFKFTGPGPYESIDVAYGTTISWKLGNATAANSTKFSYMDLYLKVEGEDYEFGRKAYSHMIASTYDPTKHELEMEPLDPASRIYGDLMSYADQLYHYKWSYFQAVFHNGNYSESTGYNDPAYRSDNHTITGLGNGEPTYSGSSSVVPMWCLVIGGIAAAVMV